MRESFKYKLEEGCTGLGITLTVEQQEKLFQYYEMVIEKNKVMNLTSITEEADFIEKHIVDSLAVVKAGKEICEVLAAGDIDIIDVGTGAGLPGIVLKIYYPSIRLTLFDSLQKRLRFLEEVIETLQFSNTKTLHGRAEDIGQNAEYREKFDFVTSRAVANLSTLSEYCLPLTKPYGIFLPYKSGDIDEERREADKAIRLLGGELCTVEKYHLPGTDIARSILIIEKIKHTPKKYPRKAGIPSKTPIQ